ncbi:programmed cell death protein 7 [Rhinophrynus dorsalis]
MPLPGGGPAGMPHPGGGPAGMPHPGGGPAGSYLHGGPQAVFQQQQTLANAPPHHNTFHCRAPMSGISQPNHSQLFPTPPRSSPYLSATDTVKDFDCFPHPMTRNINNSAFPLPAIGSTHGNAFKESDGGVSDLQRHPNNVQHFLHQDTLNMQREGISVYQNIFEVQREESHVRKDGSSPQMDPLTPSERASMQNDGQFTQQDTLRERCGDVFLQKDRPNMQSGVAFLPQNITSMLHDGHMEEHDRPNMQIESPFMHHNKQGDGMGNFVDNRPSDVFQQWLSTFLSHRGKKCIPKSEPARAPSVKEAKELIYGALQLVFQLNALCQRLESSSAAEESWSQDYPKAASARRELESKMKELEKPGYIDGLKRKLGRIRKKRLRQKQARQETDEDKEVAEQAAEKEAKIDSWRMQCIQEVEEKKRERELKAVADGVLSEVRKKQADTRKMLDVLRSLEKLRKLRKEAAGRKGVFPPPSADKTFEDHIQRLRTLVNKRTALYDVEERALRVIVEGELEEERQRHQEKRQKKEREKLLQQQREVDSILFGDSDPLPPLHPLHPFRQYYLQAEHSVVSLVQIRNEWDQFLAPSDHPDASSIPRGWVLPQLPTSDIWTTALQQAEQKDRSLLVPELPDRTVDTSCFLHLDTHGFADKWPFVQQITAKVPEFEDTTAMSFLDDIPFKLHDGITPVSPMGERPVSPSNLYLPDCSEILMCTVHDFTMERKVLEWVEGMYAKNDSSNYVRPSAPPYWMAQDGRGISPTRRSSPQQRGALPMRRCRSLSISDVHPIRLRGSWGILESMEKRENTEEDGYSEDDEYSSSEESEMEARQREARARFCRLSPQPQWISRPRTSPFVPSPPSRCCCPKVDSSSPPGNIKKRKSLTPLNSSRSELEAANKRIASLVHPHKGGTEGKGIPQSQHHRNNCYGPPLSPTPPPPITSCCCCSKRPYSAGSIPPIQCHKPTTMSLSPYSCLPPTRRSLQDTSGDILLALSQEEREVIEAVISLGYPLRRAMIALQKMGGQSLEQVLGYLGATDRLCKVGYEELLVEEAMEMFQNSEIKAAEYLRLLLQFHDMGFQQEDIKEVLLIYDNHRDRSLEELMMRAQ